MNASTSIAGVLIEPLNIVCKEFPIPAIKDDEILVEVEGCGICGTDVHEYRRDPFGLIPIVLGHEGTGVIRSLGSNITHDTVGNPLSVGDEIITSILVPENDAFVKDFPDRSNLSEGLGIYGLMPDDEYHLNGYFAKHIVIRGQSTVFKVTGMSLKQRILVEPMAVAVHALARARTTGLLKPASWVLVQGCGPIGLCMIAALFSGGFTNIIAVDGVGMRLDMARRMGAAVTLNVVESNDQTRTERIAALTFGRGVDFAFQCTGVPAAAASLWKAVRRGGGVCEVGFFIDNGDCSINPHQDFCKKEVTLVGSWAYTAQDYPDTIATVKHLGQIGVPLEELVTHTFPLAEINEAMKTNIEMRGIKIAIIP